MKTARLLLSLALSGATPWLITSAASAQNRPLPGRTVQAGGVETGVIEIADANQLGRELNEKGRVHVYGILFELDKPDIKPQSQPQLAAIADLLTRNPALRLDIVGHTDNQDAAGYSLKLSDLRAFSVVAELSLRYKIDRARLNPLGKGVSQPVASNADEAGRALNRRVELVRR